MATTMRSASHKYKSYSRWKIGTNSHDVIAELTLTLISFSLPTQIPQDPEGSPAVKYEEDQQHRISITWLAIALIILLKETKLPYAIDNKKMFHDVIPDLKVYMILQKT